MTKSEFLNEIEEILEMEPGTLKGDEVLQDLEGWDSLALLVFVSMVDSKLNVQVSAAQIAKAKTIPDLVEAVGGISG